MLKFNVGGSVSVKEPIGTRKDNMDKFYLSGFAKEIVSEVKERDPGYESEFALEMHNSLAYKGEQEYHFCDLEDELNLYKNVNTQLENPENQINCGITENPIIDVHKYPHNAWGSAKDGQMDRQQQVE
jgi:hypothetical protein